MGAVQALLLGGLLASGFTRPGPSPPTPPKGKPPCQGGDAQVRSPPPLGMHGRASGGVYLTQRTRISLICHAALAGGHRKGTGAVQRNSTTLTGLPWHKGVLNLKRHGLF